MELSKKTNGSTSVFEPKPINKISFLPLAVSCLFFLYGLKILYNGVINVVTSTSSIKSNHSI